MIYRSNLPNAFPYAITLPVTKVRLCIRELLSTRRTDVPNGSSFAVTTDTLQNGYWNLWLSRVSYNYLASIKLLADAVLSHEPPPDDDDRF